MCLLLNEGVSFLTTRRSGCGFGGGLFAIGVLTSGYWGSEFVGSSYQGLGFRVWKLKAGFDLWCDFGARPNTSSALFFKHNTALGPPYQVIVDTNFINFSIQNKV